LIKLCFLLRNAAEEEMQIGKRGEEDSQGKEDRDRKKPRDNSILLQFSGTEIKRRDRKISSSK
jgi:hypothetical protein